MINYKEAFVYIWLEDSTNKWYLGYHKGTPDDGYICSSKIVKPMIQAHPSSWTRQIIAHGTRQAMIDLERELLVELNAKNNDNSYNQHNGNGHTNTGRPLGSGKKLPIQRILNAIERQTKKSFWQLLAENYYRAIVNKDVELIEHYKEMFYKFMRIPK